MGDSNQVPFRPPQLKIKPKMIIILIIVVLAAAMGVSSFYMVDQTEEAVILRLGKFNRIASPGLHYKMPFGIEQNFNVPTQVIQNMSFGFRTEKSGVETIYSRNDYPEESVMLTGDLNIVDVEWIIQYRIVDPVAWLFNVENREKTIRDISQSTINRLVGDRGIFDVIGKERVNIETNGQEQLNEVLKSYNLGIRVTTIKLRNIVPPIGAVQDSFEDVNKAQQDMSRLINEGKEAYNREIPKARGEADKIIQEAYGYQAERVNQAKGDVARFNSVYDEYRKSKDITRSRLYIEMIEEVFKSEEKTDLIDKNLDNFLPLKNLQSGGTR